MQAKHGEVGEIHHAIATALEAVLAAGACERASIINPDSAVTWRAVARARRRAAARALNDWLKDVSQ